MKPYTKSTATEQNKFLAHLADVKPKIASDISQLMTTLRAIQQKKDELKALLDSIDTMYPVEDYNITNPEDHDWFLDEATTSAEEANAIYHAYDDTMNLISEYDELIDYVDELRDAFDEFPNINLN